MITAENVTDEMILELRNTARKRLARARFEMRGETLGLIETCNLALNTPRLKVRADVCKFARSRCAAILEARRVKATEQ